MDWNTKRWFPSDVMRIQATGDYKYSRKMYAQLKNMQSESFSMGGEDSISKKYLQRRHEFGESPTRAERITGRRHLVRKCEPVPVQCLPALSRQAVSSKIPPLRPHASERHNLSYEQKSARSLSPLRPGPVRQEIWTSRKRSSAAVHELASLPLFQFPRFTRRSPKPLSANPITGLPYAVERKTVGRGD